MFISVLENYIPTKSYIVVNFSFLILVSDPLAMLFSALVHIVYSLLSAVYALDGWKLYIYKASF
jgi:hypothetical protein